MLTTLPYHLCVFKASISSPRNSSSTSSDNASGTISDISDVQEVGSDAGINGETGCPSESAMISEVSLHPHTFRIL